MNDLLVIPDLKNDGFKYLIKVEVYRDKLLIKETTKPYYIFFGCNDRQRDVLSFWSGFSYKTKMDNPMLPFLRINKRVAEIKIDEHNKRQEKMIEKRNNPDYILKKMFENDEVFTNEEMKAYYRQNEIVGTINHALRNNILPENFEGMLFENKHFFEKRTEKFTPRFIYPAWKECYFVVEFLSAREQLISFLSQKYGKDRVIKREIKKIRKLFESKGDIEDYNTALKEKARFLNSLDLETFLRDVLQKPPRQKGEDNNG
jgi:hypothetical protein